MLVFYILRAATAHAMEPLGSDKLRWSKFSAVYRGRLLEGAKALCAFLGEHDIPWSWIVKAKAKNVDEALESFVSEMHHSNRGGPSHCQAWGPIRADLEAKVEEKPPGHLAGHQGLGGTAAFEFQTTNPSAAADCSCM